MHTFSEIVLALFLIADLALAGASRLKSAIRFVALQGWIVGVLPIILWDWQASGMPGVKNMGYIFNECGRQGGGDASSSVVCR